MKDYYALLGVNTKATKSEIKKNYYRLANKFHPDKSSDPDSASKFIAIKEAYDVLKDRKSRAQYDLKRWENIKKADQVKKDSFIVVSGAESSRLRRLRAQEKRAKRYLESKSGFTKELKLIQESLHIFSRFIIPVFGLILMTVISFSASSQLSFAFESSIGIGIGTCLFVAFLIYCIFKTLNYIFIEISKEIVSFSESYKIAYRKSAFYTLSISVIIILTFLIFLILY